MLVAKHGIKRIQIPQSMIKVERSKTKPLHKSVVLIISDIFPSDACEKLGKVLNGKATQKQEEDQQDKLSV